MPLRFDARQKLNWEKLSGDRYLAHAVLGKAEHPLDYFHWDGRRWRKRTEMVREDELFKDESLLTARGLPILLGHSKAGTYNNNKEGLLIGHAFDSFIREDSQLIQPVVVDDIRGVRLIEQAIEKGQYAEISPAYSIAGLHQRADNIYDQIGRAYDNLALLAPGMGRGGQTISLRTDSVDIAGADTQYFIFDNKRRSSLKVKIDGKEFDIEDAELALAITNANSRLDGLGRDNGTLTADKSKLEGELTGLKTRLDAAESSKPTEEAIATDIQARLDTWVVVLPALRADKADYEPDYKLTVPEIKRLYLSAKHPDIKLDGKDALFVEGLWEGLKPSLKSDDENAIDRTDALLDKLNKTPSPERTDENSEKMKAIAKGYQDAHKKNKAAMN